MTPHTLNQIYGEHISSTFKNTCPPTYIRVRVCKTQLLTTVSFSVETKNFSLSLHPPTYLPIYLTHSLPPSPSLSLSFFLSFSLTLSFFLSLVHKYIILSLTISDLFYGPCFLVNPPPPSNPGPLKPPSHDMGYPFLQFCRPRKKFPLSVV